MVKKLILTIIFILLALFASCTTEEQTQLENEVQTNEIPELQENETTDHMSVVGQTNQFLDIVGTTSNLEVASKEINYYGTANGYLTRPNNENQYPGIIMIHEWWGLNDNIKAVADTLAKEGYVVLAVDLYNGNIATSVDEAREYRTSIDQEDAILNMKAGIEYLRTNENIAKIASMGFCFGGEQSAQLSVSDAQLDATVIYYGSLPQELEEIQNVDAPVLGIFGELDTGITPDTVQIFEAGLNELGLENDITIYEGVGHAFANPGGSRFAEDETKDAWSKTIKFLESNLK